MKTKPETISIRIHADRICPVILLTGTIDMNDLWNAVNDLHAEGVATGAWADAPPGTYTIWLVNDLYYLRSTKSMILDVLCANNIYQGQPTVLSSLMQVKASHVSTCLAR